MLHLSQMTCDLLTPVDTDINHHLESPTRLYKGHFLFQSQQSFDGGLSIKIKQGSP